MMNISSNVLHINHVNSFTGNKTCNNDCFSNGDCIMMNSDTLKPIFHCNDYDVF